MTDQTARDGADPRRSHGGLRVLFLLDFLHTNMLPVIMALSHGGVDVDVVCRADPPASQTPPTNLRVRQHNHIDEVTASCVLTESAPDVIIMRHWKHGFARIARLGRQQGARTVLYNQTPLCRPLGARAFLDDAFRTCGRLAYRLPVRRVTPVRGPADGRRMLFARQFRFPMKVSPTADDRTYFQDEVPRVVCVGKLDHPRKRQHWLLDALGDIEVPFRLTLVGSGPRALRNNAPTPAFPQGKARGYREYYDRLVARCSTPSFRDRVEILEDVPYWEMRRIYDSADVFILPAENEPFAISPLEAMASGLPVIISSTNGATSYVRDNHDGFVFPSDSYESMCGSLSALVGSRRRVEAMGQAAVDTVRRRHDFDNYTPWFRMTMHESWHRPWD